MNNVCRLTIPSVYVVFIVRDGVVRGIAVAVASFIVRVFLGAFSYKRRRLEQRCWGFPANERRMSVDE